MACFRRINCLIRHSHLTLQKIVLVRKQIRIVAKIIFSTLRFLFFKLQIANVRQNVGKTFIYIFVSFKSNHFFECHFNLKVIILSDEDDDGKQIFCLSETFQ
jgi:hypothetical protein